MQMLNCCIARKIARECKSGQAQGGEESVPVIEISDDEEEDEFFECDEEMEQDEDKRDERKKSAPAWATAEGRLERIGDMKLLEVDEWMYR